MELCIQENGVKAALYEFFEKLPEGSEIFWITAFIDSNQREKSDPYKLIAKYAPKHTSITIVGRHQIEDGNRWLIKNLDQIDGVDVRRLKYPKEFHADGYESADLEETSPVWPPILSLPKGGNNLHAKLIVARSPNARPEKDEKEYYLCTGSFNCTESSLESSVESFIEITDKDAAEHAFEQVRQRFADIALTPYQKEDYPKTGHKGKRPIWDTQYYATEEDKEEEVLRRARSQDSELITTGVPDPLPEKNKSQERRPPEVPVGKRRIRKTKQRRDPAALFELSKASEQGLTDWPKLYDGSGEHPSKGWQKARFDRLCDDYRRHSKKDNSLNYLLYMPVGLGKTFIAVRWMLHELDQLDEKDKLGSKKGLYLVPNRWIRESVTDALKNIQKTPNAKGIAWSDWIDVESYWRVHYRTDSELEEKYAVLIADECHNWNPWNIKSDARSYNGVVNRLRKLDLPTLGLSATPCRMKDGKFDQFEFIRHFIAPHDTRPKADVPVELKRPIPSLQKAITDELLPEPIWVNLLENLSAKTRNSITEYLQCPRRGAVQMGDYHRVILSKVTELLYGDKKLLTELKRLLTGKKKVVVFLPPIETRNNRFVDKVSEWQRDGWWVQDFRHTAENPEEKARDVFVEFQKESKPAILLTIDRFAEGVSVPEIDCLVMLRASLSPRVSIQAIGRGLRRAKGKEQITIIDGVFFKDRFEEWCRAEGDPPKESAGHDDSKKPKYNQSKNPDSSIWVEKLSDINWRDLRQTYELVMAVPAPKFGEKGRRVQAIEIVEEVSPFPADLLFNLARLGLIQSRTDLNEKYTLKNRIFLKRLYNKRRRGSQIQEKKYDLNHNPNLREQIKDLLRCFSEQVLIGFVEDLRQDKSRREACDKLGLKKGDDTNVCDKLLQLMIDRKHGPAFPDKETHTRKSKNRPKLPK